MACYTTKTKMAISPVFFLFFSGFFLALAPAAQAEGAAPNILPRVTVQAPRSVGLTGSESASSNNRHTTLYDETKLEMGHERSVDEILRGEPGITVIKAGGNGIGPVSLRGANGQGLITLDGLPVPDSVPGAPNLNAILPDGLRQMEVHRGFGPASRPFSTLGGVIRMISRDAIDNSADFRVEGGTFGFLKETFRSNHVTERARLALTVNRSDAFDGSYHAKKSNGNTERDPFHGTQVQLKTGLDISNGVTWEGSMLYRDSWNARDRLGARDGVRIMVDERKNSFLAEQVWMAQNTLKARINNDWSTRLQLGYTQTGNRVETSGLKLGYSTDFYMAHWESDHRLWHGDADDAIHLIWGGEGRHERAEAPTYTRVGAALLPGITFREKRSQQAGFVETRFAYGKLSGDVGVRHEGYDRFNDQTLVHAGAAWQMLPTLKLRANGGNGFRIPGYAEKLFPLIGRIDIKPERGAGGDLGFDWQPGSNIKLGLTGFYSRFDNLTTLAWNPITLNGCTGACISNTPNASVAGIEASGEVIFNDQWRGGVSHTYTDSRNLDTNKRIPARPRDQVRAWGEWHAPVLPLTLWAEGVYRSHSPQDVGNTVVLNNVFRANAQASYKVSPKLDLYMRVENIGNNKTPDAFSYDFPGTAVYGGVALKLW